MLVRGKSPLCCRCCRGGRRRRRRRRSYVVNHLMSFGNLHLDPQSSSFVEERTNLRGVAFCRGSSCSMTLPEGSNFMVLIILWCVLLPQIDPEGHILKAGSFRPFDRLCFEIHRPVSSCAGLHLDLGQEGLAGRETRIWSVVCCCISSFMF
jgi:hypothetical protein